MIHVKVKVTSMFNTFGYNCDISNMEEQKDQKIPGGGSLATLTNLIFVFWCQKTSSYFVS